MARIHWLAFIGILISAARAADVETSYTLFDGGLLADGTIFEQFDYESIESSPWKVSANKTYVGQWEIEGAANAYSGFDGDKGLVMKQAAKRSAISLPVDVRSSRKSPLVIQYEVKFQDGITCGGAYIKLLDAPFDALNFNSDTKYQVMFGPDICGSQNKIHFIINRCNPNNGECEEKHLTHPPMARTGQLTNLYTLILYPRGAFEIRVNGQVAKYANVLDKPHLLTPGLNPPMIIEDPNDVMPEGWEDEPEYIPDPDALKPENYDELYGNRQIRDVDAVKPKNWLEDEPEYVDNPKATKPALWNDEEDGEYRPPKIANPKCEGMVCGKKWEDYIPMVENLDYKGPWVAPSIPNPKFNGEWRARQIVNPDYYEDTKPFDLEPIGGIGFELWSMEGNIMFDNIYLGHSVEEAELVGNSTFVPKRELENANYELHRPKAKHEPVPPPTFSHAGEPVSDLEHLGFFEFFRLLFKLQLNNVFDFYYDFQLNPAETIIREPVKFVSYCVGFVFLFTIFFGFGSVVVFVATLTISSILSPLSDTKHKKQSKPEVHVTGTNKSDTEVETIDVVPEPKIVEIFDDEDKTSEIRQR